MRLLIVGCPPPPVPTPLYLHNNTLHMLFLFGLSHRGVYVSSWCVCIIRVTSFLHLGQTWRVKSMFKEATRVRAGSLRQLLGLLIFPLMPWHNSHTPLLVLSATLSLTSPKESCLLVRLLAISLDTILQNNVCINFLCHYCITQQTWNVLRLSVVL